MSRKFGFDHKLERADYHLQTLNEKVKRWLARKQYSIVNDFDAERGLYVVSLAPVGRPPDDIAPIVGDIIHNLRSALDHVFYSLVMSYSSTALTESLARSLEFPIFTTAGSDHVTKRDDMIGRIGPDAETIIDKLQPYHAGDLYRTNRLWLLNRLSNIWPAPRKLSRNEVESVA